MKNAQLLMMGNDYVGELTLKDTISLSNPQSVYCDGNFVIVGTATKIQTYSFSTSGQLTLVDSVDHTSTKNQIYSDGDYVYVAAKLSGLLLYAIDGSGNLTFKDSDNVSNGTYWGVWADANYIYCNGQLNSRGVHVYSIGTGDALVFENTKSFTNSGFKISGDGTYIYNAYDEDGTIVYSVDSSGVLTQTDTDDNGGNYTDVDNNSSYVLYAAGTGGLLSYSVGASGVLTLEDSNTSLGTIRSLWSYNDVIFVQYNTSTIVGGIGIFTIDGSGNLTFVKNVLTSDTLSIVQLADIRGYQDHVFAVGNSYLLSYKTNLV